MIRCCAMQNHFISIRFSWFIDLRNLSPHIRILIYCCHLAKNKHAVLRVMESMMSVVAMGYFCLVQGILYYVIYARLIYKKTRLLLWVEVKNMLRTWQGFNCLCYRTTLRFFFTRLWSVRKALISDTHYPVISGFSIAHAYKYKTKRQAKMKRRQKKKWHFCCD